MKRLLSAFVLTLVLSLPLQAATPVDINHADAAKIAQSLDGVGIVKAQAIVAYRKAHGAFKSADDLAQVKGIGKHTLDNNRKAIRLGGSKK